MTFTRIFLIALCMLFIESTVMAQSKPGDIDKNAKYIDADQLQYFNEGVAVVRKGKSSALINTSGDFIVPFNKYFFVSEAKDGMIIVSEGVTEYEPPYAILDLTGKKLYSSKFQFKGIFDGFAIGEDNSNYIFVDRQGKVLLTPRIQVWKYKNTTVSRQWYDGMISFSYPDHTNMGDNYVSKYGYMDRSLKIVAAPEFEFAVQFSEGLAVVGKKNEFGELKYGFVDKQGKLVIPLKYTKRPGSFHSGRALVYPLNNSEFTHAFIDKNDNIVIKLKKYSFFKSEEFQSGYLLLKESGSNNGGLWIMDSVGTILSLKELFEQADRNKSFVKHDQYFTSRILTISDKFLQFDAYEDGNGQRFATIIDLTLRQLVFPKAFQQINGYDPVSKFRYAEKQLADKSTVKGYINSDGVFKIVLGAKSVF